MGSTSLLLYRHQSYRQDQSNVSLKEFKKYNFHSLEIKRSALE